MNVTELSFDGNRKCHGLHQDGPVRRTAMLQQCHQVNPQEVMDTCLLMVPYVLEEILLLNIESLEKEIAHCDKCPNSVFGSGDTSAPSTIVLRIPLVN